MVVPLARPMLTDEHPGEVKAKEPEHTRRSEMLKNYLDRLKAYSGYQEKRQSE